PSPENAHHTKCDRDNPNRKEHVKSLLVGCCGRVGHRQSYAQTQTDCDAVKMSSLKVHLHALILAPKKSQAKIQRTRIAIRAVAQTADTCAEANICKFAPNNFGLDAVERRIA